jgi:Big-like domain-containing protein
MARDFGAGLRRGRERAMKRRVPERDRTMQRGSGPGEQGGDVSVTRSTGLAGVAMIGLAVLLQGCAPQARPASGTRLFATDFAGGAKNCNVPKVSPTAGKETPATMTVGNDGGWCGITVDNNGHPYSAGLLATRPTHGQVYIHSVGDATRIDYTPNKGYAGTDSFTVRLLPGDAAVRATVTVGKAPAAAKSG